MALQGSPRLVLPKAPKGLEGRIIPALSPWGVIADSFIQLGSLGHFVPWKDAGAGRSKFATGHFFGIGRGHFDLAPHSLR